MTERLLIKGDKQSSNLVGRGRFRDSGGVPERDIFETVMVAMWECVEVVKWQGGKVVRC